MDGDLYFSVHCDPRFGQVSGWDESRMLEVFADRGGDPDRAGKKHPLDCLLWQAERPGEPAWDFALGRGRPGWHVECSSTLRYLGESFDVQGGGSDLVFPHHEMSASEAQAAFEGLTFAKAYVHAGMVGYQGEKMSKSRGNLVFVSKLRERGVDPMAVRLALLGHHYREDWEWTDGDLVRAETLLEDLRVAVASPTGAVTSSVVRGVRHALADDLNAPMALQALRRLGRDQRARTGPSSGRGRGRTSSRGRPLGSSCDASVVAGVAALQALELTRDRLATGLGEVGGVPGLLERPDVVADLPVLLGELVDPALPRADSSGRSSSGMLTSSRSSSCPTSARVALGHGGWAT